MKVMTNLGRHSCCDLATHMRTQHKTAAVDEWLRLVRAEFLEVPGLTLTSEEARRFWGLDREACDQLLAALVDSRFLRRTRNNRYLRADGSV